MRVLDVFVEVVAHAGDEYALLHVKNDPWVAEEMPSKGLPREDLDFSAVVLSSLAQFASPASTSAFMNLSRQMRLEIGLPEALLVKSRSFPFLRDMFLIRSWTQTIDTKNSYQSPILWLSIGASTSCHTL